MNLRQFKKKIESLEKGKVLQYSISEPFSWRGSYDQVCFAFIMAPSSREEILAKIEKAYTETFEGYKGGEYRYNDRTLVNFEDNHSSWSDGRYCKEKIEEITQEEQYQSQEMKLITLAFCK